MIGIKVYIFELFSRFRNGFLRKCARSCKLGTYATTMLLDLEKLVPSLETTDYPNVIPCLSSDKANEWKYYCEYSIVNTSFLCFLFYWFRLAFKH